MYVKEEPDSDNSEMSQAESEEATPASQSQVGDADSEPDSKSGRYDHFSTMVERVVFEMGLGSGPAIGWSFADQEMGSDFLQLFNSLQLDFDCT